MRNNDSVTVGKTFQPFMGYLSNEEQSEIIQAFTSTGIIYSHDVRSELFNGIPPNFFNLLEEKNQPALRLSYDLRKLSQAERLRDGTVPLILWLRNAAQLLASLPVAQVFEGHASRVQALSSGAPRPKIDASTTQALVLRKEVTVGEDDTVPISFLAGGARAASSVAKILVPRYESSNPKMVSGVQSTYWGTAWMLTSDIVITNHHVIDARSANDQPASLDDLKLQVMHSRLHFDYDADNLHGVEVPVHELLLADATLDYALLRLAQKMTERHPLFLLEQMIKVPDTKSIAANIIQHPRGRSKRVAIRNNLIFQAPYPLLRYFSDTDEGSSGSPVCDDSWRVLALHQGAARIEATSFQGRTTGYINQGIQIAALIEHWRTNNSRLYEEIRDA